jgi:hypothetical protein
MYSSLKSTDSSITVLVEENISRFDSMMNDKNIFLGPFFAMRAFSSDKLGKFYNLRPGPYCKLSNSQRDTSFHEEYFTKANVKLAALHGKVYSDGDPMRIIDIPFRLTNISSRKINSISDCQCPIYMSYHLYDEKGKLILWDGKRTPFEIDISDEYTQSVSVNLPHKKGIYTVEADILTENKRWWGLNSKCTLMVK